jgi:hypothetical protein
MKIIPKNVGNDNKNAENDKKGCKMMEIPRFTEKSVKCLIFQKIRKKLRKVKIKENTKILLKIYQFIINK